MRTVLARQASQSAGLYSENFHFFVAQQYHFMLQGMRLSLNK